MKDSTSKCRINYNLIPLPLLAEQTAIIDLEELLMTPAGIAEAAELGKLKQEYTNKNHAQNYTTRF